MAHSSGDGSPMTGTQMVPEELQPLLEGLLNEFTKLRCQNAQLKRQNESLTRQLIEAGISAPHGDPGPTSQASGSAGSSTNGQLVTDDYLPTTPGGTSSNGASGTPPPAEPRGSGAFYRQEAAHNLRAGDQPAGGPPAQTAKLVTDEEMMFVAEELDTSSWQPFMRTLGLKNNQLDVVKHNHRGIEEQKYQALVAWKDSYGLQAKTEIIVKTLLSRRHRYIAEKFCVKFPEYKYLL